MKKYLLFLAIGAISYLGNATECLKDTFIVVIDRGHDAVDLGAQVGDESEYQILNQLVPQLVGEVNSNVEVIYHNPTGEQLTIDQRTAQINALNPDLVISIHIGSSKNGARQAAVLLNEKNVAFDQSKNYSTQLISHLSNDAYFSTIRTEVEGIALLEKVNAPAIMLEIGNMNAVRDRYYLQTNGVKRVSLNFTSFLNDLN